MKTLLRRRQSSLKTITPPLVSYSEEQTSPISTDVADEVIQKDSAELDKNTLITPFNHPVFEEAESSLTTQNPPTHRNIIGVKWIWKNKTDAENTVIRNKSRLVAKGYHEEEGIYFEKSSALVARLEAVHQSPHGIFINQSQYTLELLKKHRIDGYDSICTPMDTTKLDVNLHGTPTDQKKHHSMIGGIMYLTASRPDIAFATFVCARYQARPMVKHLKDVKRIFRFLKQTYNMGLRYPKDSRFELIAYSDANHVGCHDDCKSTSGGILFFGEKLVSWSSKKQDCTTMSTAEAEYVSLSAYYAQIIWMKTQLLDYGCRFNKILMYYDSKSAIAISCNSVQHSCTKHINIRYHFIKEHVERGTFELYFVGTEYQLADLFTKALPKEIFEYLVHRIGMRCMTPT
ncbi:retrovirus-related pol polyprotein from transposon TNT 1-94 [Tanacetum coccineum]